MPRLTRFDEFEPSKAERRSFDCGSEELNDWLVRFAAQAMASRDAVTYLLHEGRVIIGYMTLSAGSVSRAHAASRAGRRAPDPVPMMLLGRMGVHVERKGLGYGAELVRQALLHAMSASGSIGARGLMLHALDEQAQSFYRHLGFEESPITPRLMMVTFADVEATAMRADELRPRRPQ